jgi:hypothetical protein
LDILGRTLSSTPSTDALDKTIEADVPGPGPFVIVEAAWKEGDN